MSWEIKFGIKAQCKGCGEDIFPKSKVLIRCVVCTQQLTAAANSMTGNKSEEDGALGDNSATGQIGNPLPSANTLDLCPECFAGRVEIGSHKSSHNYQFIDDGGFPLFPTTKRDNTTTISNNPSSNPSTGTTSSKTIAVRWTAREHLFLLTAIERHGYGNWEDISKAVNTEMNVEGKPSNINYRTPLAVMEEYTSTFLHGIIGQRTWREDLRGRARDHTLGNPLLPPIQPNDPPANLTTHEAIMLGYLPLRDDFEIEYENDAESMVSHLQYQPAGSTNSTAQGPIVKNVPNTANQGSHSAGGIQPSSIGGGSGPLDEDDSLDQELKLAHIEMYKIKLRERERRRRVTREHQLIGQFFRENPLTYDARGRAVCSGPVNSTQKTIKKSLSQKDGSSGDIMEVLKILAEFQGVTEYQAFMGSVSKETEIKHRIKDLMRYQRYGIKSLQQSLEYETQQKARKSSRKKNEKLRNQQKPQGSNPSLQSPNLSSANVESPLGSIMSFEQSGWGSSTSVATPSSTGADVQSPASSIKSEDYMQQPSTASPATPLLLNSPQSLGLTANTISGTQSFCITSYPGHEILSTNEKRLCTNLKLTPAHYISYKTCLLKDHLQKKKGQTPKPLNPSGLDKNDRKVIFNFLMRAGWITAY